MVGKNFSSGDLDDVSFLPIGAALGDGVPKILAVFRDGVCGELRSAVGRKRVGIEKRARRTGQTFLDIQHALILEPTVLAVEEVAGAAEGRRVLGKIVEQIEARADLVTVGNLGEIRGRELILRLDPARGFGRAIVLEPAIRIGDLDAVVVIDLLCFAGGWISKRLTHCGDGYQTQRGRGNLDGYHAAKDSMCRGRPEETAPIRSVRAGFSQMWTVPARLLGRGIRVRAYCGIGRSAKMANGLSRWK
jgi:hypothetical protein